MDLKHFFEKPSASYPAYCSLFTLSGSYQILPNLFNDFKDCIAACVKVLQMQPRQEFLEPYISKVVWGIYSCTNISPSNLSNFMLGGVLSKMCECRTYPVMKDQWEKNMQHLPASFPVHSTTIRLIEKLMTQPREKNQSADLNEDLRSNINDLCYASFFLRTEVLKTLTSEQFLMLARELMSPSVQTVYSLQKYLTDLSLPNQLVIRLQSTFFIMENHAKTVVKRSIMLVGDAPSESKMTMITLHAPLEFQNQATVTRVHVLKPRGMDFCLNFNFITGLLPKCMLSGVVLEGGGVMASGLEEFSVCNSLIHDCNIAVYAKNVDYLFLGDREATAQTLLAARCVQLLQAEDASNVLVSNVMVQDVGGVFFVGPCSIFEASNISVVDCGRLGIVSAASPAHLSGCSIACALPHLETRGHGARYSMVSLRNESSFPVSDIPVMSMPLVNPKKLSFQPDPLGKRQRIEVERSDLDLIKQQCRAESLDSPPVAPSGVLAVNFFQPETGGAAVESSGEAPSLSSFVNKRASLP